MRGPKPRSYQWAKKHGGDRRSDRRRPGTCDPLNVTGPDTYFLIVIQTVFTLPSCSVAFSCQVPPANPLLVLVFRLKCHSFPTSRNWLPAVAPSVGVASIGGSESVLLLHLTACRV